MLPLAEPMSCSDAILGIFVMEELTTSKCCYLLPAAMWLCLPTDILGEDMMEFETLFGTWLSTCL